MYPTHCYAIPLKILFYSLFISLLLTSFANAQNCDFYRSKYHCPADKRFNIHLSFDDGVADVTPQILDVLKREKIPATFFILGTKVNCKQYRVACTQGNNQKSCESLKQCQVRRQTLKRIKKEGHLIGSHSYDHYHHSKLSPAELHRAIKRSKEILQPFFTTNPIPFRLPFGDGWFNRKEQPHILQALEDQGFTHVAWEMSGFDWNPKNQQGSKILDNIMEQMCSGRNGTVLLHDGDFEKEHIGRTFTAKHLAEWIPVMRCAADFVPLNFFKKELQ